MTERRITSKIDLLAEIERAWTALNTYLEQLSAGQLTARRDQQGWRGKDHLIHLTAWERSVVFFLQGQPRHVGLGVAESLYLQGEDDQINAAIQQQHQAMPLAEVLAQFRHTHQQMMTLLAPLTDADLQKPYHHYLLQEPGQATDRPAINLIYGNTAHHFDEHLGWIERLAGP